jgi:hypothetical protein
MHQCGLNCFGYHEDIYTLHNVFITSSSLNAIPKTATIYYIPNQLRHLKIIFSRRPATNTIYSLEQVETSTPTAY